MEREFKFTKFSEPAIGRGARSRNTLYVLLGVWIAIAAFAITIFAAAASHDQTQSTMIGTFAAAAVYTLVVIGYLLLRQWRTLERDLHLAEARAVVADGDGRLKRGQTVKVTTPSRDGRPPNVTFYCVAEPDRAMAEEIVKHIAVAGEAVEAVGPLPKSVIAALRLKPGEASHA